MRRSVVAGSAFVTAAAVAAFLQCAPTEDESVTIVTACDVAQLRAEPVETTVRLFSETSTDLLARAKQLEQRFVDVCNKINKEVGGTESPDLRTSCNAIAARVAKAQAIPPPDAGQNGVRPQWVRVTFPSTCELNFDAQSQCLSQCANAPCDVKAACPSGVSGNCAADCNGLCARLGDNACSGRCRGACSADAGQECTAGECVGTCGDSSWTGQCAAGCDLGFIGVCKGTCTGTCDGSPIGEPASDAGADAGADAGIPPAPGGADGNCKGVCTGQCSSQASGLCNAPCRGQLSGGRCGSCNGTCVGGSDGVACVGQCRGECAAQQTQGACAGTCTGTCSQPFANGGCTGRPTCDANPQCQDVCALQAALKATCAAPTDLEVRIAGDFEIYAALKKYGPEFSALVAELELLNERSVPLSRVTLADYGKLGATRDRVRVCVLEATRKADDARGSIALSVGASQVVNGTTF